MAKLDDMMESFFAVVNDYDKRMATDLVQIQQELCVRTSPAYRVRLAMACAEMLMQTQAGSAEMDAIIHTILNEERCLHKSLPKGYTIQCQGTPAKNARLALSQFITKNRCLAPAYTRSVDDGMTLIGDALFKIIKKDHDFYHIDTDASIDEWQCPTIGIDAATLPLAFSISGLILFVQRWTQLS